jgi:hypothetical protein
LPEVPADRLRERGSAAVEFALLLPILLLLLLALVQVGVIARDSLVLTQASRAGAREAAVQGTAAVRAAAVGLDPDRLSVVATWSGARGAPVTVDVAYEAPVASLLAGWLLPSSVSLRASATMRQEFA